MITSECETALTFTLLFSFSILQTHGAMAVVCHKRKRDDGVACPLPPSAPAATSVVPRALEIGDPVPYDIPELADVKGISLDQRDDDQSGTRLAKTMLKEYAWRVAVKAFKRVVVSHATACPGELIDLILQYDVYIVLLIMQRASLVFVNLDDLDLEGEPETRAFDPEWRASMDSETSESSNFPVTECGTSNLSVLLVPPRTIREYAATEGCAVRIPRTVRAELAKKNLSLSTDDEKLRMCALNMANDTPRCCVVVTDDTGKPRALDVQVVLFGKVMSVLIDRTRTIIPVDRDDEDDYHDSKHYRADGSNIHVCWTTQKRVMSWSLRVQWSDGAPVCSLLRHYSFEMPRARPCLASGGFVCWNRTDVVFCAPEKQRNISVMEFAPPRARYGNVISSVTCVPQSQTFVVRHHTGELAAITQDLTGEHVSARSLPSCLYTDGSICCRVF